MKTLDCSTLETLIENDEPVELIDVRPKEEFSAVHIPGARSVPFAELVQPRLKPTKIPMAERVYVISDDQASASLASGILHASGGVDAVVVEGGMQTWVEQGLPVLRAGAPVKLVHILRGGAILLGIFAGIAVSLKEFAVAVLLLVIAVLLLLKTGFFSRNSPENIGTRSP
jgi:rhodanese-related sulfurtransferase